MRRTIGFVGIALILVGAVVLATRLPGPATTQSSSSQTTTIGLAKGVTFTPPSFDAQSLTRFFAQAKLAGSVVTWAGDWDALSDPKSAPFVVGAQAQKQGLSFVPELQVLNSSSGQLIRPLNSSNEDRYRSLAVSFVQSYKPHFLALGVEVNLLWEKSPADFQAFVAFFNSTRAAIRAASPETSVFTIFQLEKLKGLGGGLFGGVNDTSKAEWTLLADFPSADLLGFTTYPGLLFHDPASIPTAYYAEISQHTQKPVAFTEVGWQSSGLNGWPNNETSQAGFVKAFFGLTSSLQRSVVVWAFVYDQQTAAPFNSMGLLDADGNPKQAWEAWLNS